jgi:RNA polymerase sigma factor (sigma-70 family)
MQDDGTVDTDLVGMPAADKLLNSDPHDFAGLYIRHRASFTLHARRYLRDARDADEVVQEAFLRLFLALPELETELQALAYCRRTITNLCIDRYRAQARRPSLVDLDSAGALDLAEDDPGDPVVRAEDAAMVRAALSLLSPLHRAALVKREIEEKTLPVIAEELEIPEDSVKHVLFRARRALRRILAGTSLAPGSDAEIAGALGRAVRSSSGGVAAFLMLLVLGLGTGPDLRAVPVVGTDLPDLIPVTDLVEAVGGAASAVGQAVTVVADEVAGAVTSGGSPSGVDPVEDGPAEAPAAGAAASPSPSPTPSAAAPRPTATPAADPSALPSPLPSAAASALPSPSVSPSVAPSPVEEEPSPQPSPKPTRPTVAPSPAPPAEPSASPAPTASPNAPTGATTSGSGNEARKGKKSPSPSASPKPSPTPDAESYQTPGLEYAYDPDTGEMILVPIGETAESWRD